MLDPRRVQRMDFQLIPMVNFSSTKLKDFFFKLKATFLADISNYLSGDTDS